MITSRSILSAILLAAIATECAFGDGMMDMEGDGNMDSMDGNNHEGHNHGDGSMSTPFCVGSGVAMSMFGLGASFNNVGFYCLNLFWA